MGTGILYGLIEGQVTRVLKSTLVAGVDFAFLRFYKCLVFDKEMKQ